MKKVGKLMLLGAALGALVVPGEARAQFGASLAVADGQVLAAEPGRVLGPGAVLVFEKQGGAWVAVGEITASDGEAGDRFGSAMAADGSTLLVAGSKGVYVFEKTGNGWTEQGKLVASDVGETDGFGESVALSGNHALVGAPGQGNGAGAVYLFRRSGREWTQAGEKLTAAVAGTAFGASVAFDGDHALVGAPMANNRTGAAYAFRATDTGMEPMGLLEVNGLSGRTQFGQGVWVGGGWALVQAPFADGATGAVFAYALGADGWAPEGRLSAFDGGTRHMFGAAVAVAGDEIWVGAAGADNLAGAAYVFHLNEAQDGFSGVTRLGAGEGFSGRTRTGSTLASDGEVTAVGVLGADNGAGSVLVLERGTDGEWTRSSVLVTPMEGFDPVKGGEVACAEGSAVGWDCSEVDLVSFVPVAELAGEEGVRGIVTNDNWGWRDPETGRHYALVGMTDRASFVDMTDPLNPRVVGILPMTPGANGSAWRDIKTYRNHAFIVSDGAGQHGMQVFDLTRLRDHAAGDPVVFDADALYTDIASAHNIVINEETGFAFSVGSSSGGVTCGGGLHIIDIREPKAPAFAGCFSDPQTGRASTGYTHDAQCVTYRGPDADHAGREICFGANETALSIADVTDKENTVALSRAAYPSVGYSHQGWLSEDQRWFYMNDELDELQGLVNRTRTMVWDVSDLDDPQLAAEHLGVEESSDHNLYVVGNLMYQSNYQSGLRILDIQDPANPVEVAFFDTVPYGDNGAGFGGSWSNYPFFDNGLVIVTSGNEGLFLVRPTIRRTVF
ncbi:MAG TPA: choice-of-anchor B family protein [Longimicrobiales bacterium]|nr:choice-of-anchor B family protein [Longimicrobiales bacterium]